MVIINLITYLYLEWTNYKILNNMNILYQIAERI